MRMVLVHGAWHGAWCWELLVPELAARGCDVVTVDLPGHGARLAEPAEGQSQYADAVVAALEPGTVLVGHSMGGAVVTLAADRAPELIERLVYVAAFAPRDGESIVVGYGDGAPDLEGGGVTLGDDGTTSLDSLAVATELFYADCEPKVAAAAFERLAPEPAVCLLEPVPLPNFDRAAIPRRYVLCTQDRTVAPDVQRRIAERLGVEPVEIDTSHSPFFSRPAELADLLVAP
jgi:pimeloyl-ACP methyl ester carboxylesterase